MSADPIEDDAFASPKARLLMVLRNAVRTYRAGHMMTNYYVHRVVSDTVMVVVAETAIGTKRKYRVRIQEIRE